jgi:hypothetical protein
MAKRKENPLKKPFILEKPMIRMNVTTFEHPDCTRIEIVLTGDEDSRSLTKAAVLMAIDKLETLKLDPLALEVATRPSEGQA